MAARWPGSCTTPRAMTFFDRVLEPLAVLFLFAIVWLGTLL
jgi:hypothetical protein